MVNFVWERVSQVTEQYPLSLLTDVRIKRAEYQEFVGTNTTVGNKRVSVKQVSTVQTDQSFQGLVRISLAKTDGSCFPQEWFS